MNLSPYLTAVTAAGLVFLLGCSTDKNEQIDSQSPQVVNQPTELSAPVASTESDSTSKAVPDTQMAIVQIGNGGPEVFHYKSIPVLDPGADEVLIKVVAAAINPIDRRFREGRNRPPQTGNAGGPPGANPGGMGAPTQQASASESVPGGDLSGIIARVGSNVSNLSVGDEVFAKIPLGGDQLNGSYSEYAIVAADQTNLKPADQSFEEAAGLGTVGVTALRTIKHAGVSEGDRVFINGIAGGIGSSAAQFALDRGAYVLGTASGGHHEYLESIGVHEAINYREVQFDEVIDEPVDIVIETVGTTTANQALNILKPGGKLVSIAGAADQALCEEKQVDCSRIGGEFGWPNSEMLAEVAEVARSGAYRLNVDTVFPLQEAAAAQDLNFNVGTRGKIILLVDDQYADK